MSFGEGIFSSVVHGLGPSLIGVEPSRELKRFQNEHPLASFIAELGGTLVPYGIMTVSTGGVGTVGTAIASRTPMLARVLKAAETLSKASSRTSRVAGAGLKEISRFAPLEIARVGLAPLGADEGRAYEHTKEVALSAGVDLLLIGGSSAAFRYIGTFRPVPGKATKSEGAIADAFPQYNLAAPVQERLRQVNLIRAEHPLEGVPGQAREALGEVTKQLTNDILEQTPRQGQQALVRRLTSKGKNGAKAASSFFNRLGKTKDGLLIKKFVRANKLPKEQRAGGFVKQQELDQALREAGITDANLAHMQFPRLIETTSEKGRDKLLGTRTKDGVLRLAGFEPVGTSAPRFNNAWIAQEADGLFVVVRRIKPRPRKAKFGDRYLFFKTDQPDRFFPEASRFGKILERNAFALEEAAIATEVEFQTQQTRFIDRIIKAFPAGTDLRGVPNDVLPEAVSRGLTAHWPRSAENLKEFNQGSRFILNKLKRVVGPGLFRFSEAPMFQRLHTIYQAAFTRATALTEEEFFGKPIFSESKTLLGALFRTPGRRNSIREAIKAVYKDGVNSKAVQDLNVARLAEMSPEEAKALLGASDDVVRLLRGLDKLDSRKAQETISAELLALGKQEFRPRKNHYMISRTWRGNFRVPVYEEGNKTKILGYGSGYGRDDAITEADFLVERLRAGGIKAARSLDPNDMLRAGARETDIELASKVVLDEKVQKLIRDARVLAVRQPGRFQPRTGKLGFTQVLDEKEFSQAVYGNLSETNRYITGTLLQHKLQADRARAQKAYPELWEQFVETANSLMGKRGQKVAAIEESIDKTLGPWLGPRAASELIRQVNRLQFNFTLGAGDLGFVALNALTPIQTALPEVSLLDNLPPERFMRYYGMNLVNSRQGLVPVWSLEPLKIMREAFRDMVNPSPEIREMFLRALRHNVIDKKFMEEFVGQTSENVLRFREVLSGKLGPVKYLQALSEFLPAKSEEFSRGMAFLMGRRMGQFFRNVDGSELSSEQLFQFASQFTNRTMYLYTVADRPRIITGSVGTLFGLFKNWSMHYIANGLVYSNEALRGNFAPLLWMMGGTTTVAGVGGTAGFGVADALSRVLTDEPLVQNLYEAFGYTSAPNRTVDAIFYGLPAFAGVSLQGRAAAPGAEFVRDVNMLFSVSLLDRARYLGLALGESFDRWQATGEHPIKSEQVRDLYIRALAPRTLYRYMAAAGDRGLKSLRTGNLLVSDITFGDALGLTLGLRPVDIEKSFTVSTELWEKQNEMQEKVASFGDALAEARMTRNRRRVREVQRQAVIAGVPLDSVERSAAARREKAMTEIHERQFEVYPRRQMEKALFGR